MKFSPTQFLREKKSQFAFAALVVSVLFLAGILVGRTLSRGDDFLVFYGVAQRFWSGVRPYDQITYGNMVFKYPPWILPAFLPFGFFDPLTARILWGLVEAGSLAAVVVRLHRGYGALGGVRPWVQTLFLLGLFGLFGSHGVTGQITLPLLALCLWIDPLRDSFAKFFLLVWALSSKMTSMFPLFHGWKRYRTHPRRWIPAIGGLVVLFVVLSLPIFYKSYDRNFAPMREEWVAAMFSGTQDAANVRIGFTTREVQGLPSLLLRKAGLDERKPLHVVFALALSTVLLGTLWAWYSRRLSDSAQWLGWLALLPATQALAWFHVFLFAYPVLVIAAEAALRRTDLKRFYGVLFCLFLVGAVTSKTMGSIGYEAELASVKLWGTLGALILFRFLLAPVASPSHDHRGNAR